MNEPEPWPTKSAGITMTSNHQSSLPSEIAALREEVEDLRACAIVWRELYEAAVRRSVELEAQLAELTNDVDD